jgi:hypothetical protein
VLGVVVDLDDQGVGPGGDTGSNGGKVHCVGCVIRY